MKRIAVKTEKSYDILIGEDIFSTLGKECEKIFDSKKVLVLTDENVGDLYLKKACETLSASGFSVEKYIIESGEKSKNIDTVIKIVDYLSEKSFNRTNGIIVLGGGVVGDIAGFVASIYMRGIKYVNVPTSLLSQVDSSIGGKTGVDTKYGKNLIGTFCSPCLVFTDTKLLETLPENEYESGLGEVLKYAILDDEMFDLIKNKSGIERIVEKCVEIKKDIVEKDEKDLGIRGILNLGHTLAHAIEKDSDYKISHGIAVATGIYHILMSSLKKGYIDRENYDKAMSLFSVLEIKPVLGIEKERLLSFVFNDKKSFDGGIELIVPRKIGKVERVKMTKEEAEEFILCRK